MAIQTHKFTVLLPDGSCRWTVIALNKADALTEWYKTNRVKTGATREVYALIVEYNGRHEVIGVSKYRLSAARRPLHPAQSPKDPVSFHDWLFVHAYVNEASAVRENMRLVS